MDAEQDHHGVAPVPFLNTTWQQRRAEYWQRRIGTAVLFALLTALVGSLAVAANAVMLSPPHSLVHIGVAAGYDLTAIPGFLLGRKQVAAAPAELQSRFPRIFFPAAVVVFLIAPFVTGLMLALLLAMLGRDFLGEHRAREITESIRRAGLLPSPSSGDRGC